MNEIIKTLNLVPEIIKAMEDYAINCGITLNRDVADYVANKLYFECDSEYVEFDVEELDRENNYELFIM